MRHFILTFFVLIFFVVIARAQDAPVTIVPYGEATPTAEIAAQPTPIVLVSAQATETSLWQVVIGMFVAFLSGGGFTLAGVWAVIRYVKDNKPMLALIEGLANSQPVERRALVYEFGKALGDAAEVVKEVTDGVPVVDKPTPMEVDQALYPPQAGGTLTG